MTTITLCESFDITKQTSINKNEIKLSDGNTIYVDLNVLAKQSKLISTILDDNKGDDLNNIVFQGDIETYKLIYKLCDNTNGSSITDYIKTNLKNLDGSSIINTMDYLLIDENLVMIMLGELLEHYTLAWKYDIPIIYFEKFIDQHLTAESFHDVYIRTNHVVLMTIHRFKLQTIAFNSIMKKIYNKQPPIS